MDINETALKVEEFMAGYTGHGGRKPKEVRVRPSGDDFGVIKIWVDLGAGVSDAICAAWAKQCEKDVLPHAGEYQLHIRAESL